uniref:Protein kinase domain-containing protein n=1 Tax=Haptolina brevifila TaxID=156173 RepID=A0A7S2NNQ6_9EUKA
MLKVLGRGAHGTVWLLADSERPAVSPAGNAAVLPEDRAPASTTPAVPESPPSLPPRGAFSSQIRFDTALCVWRAVKISPPTRFTAHEQRTLAQLHHAFIVPFLGASSDACKNYLVLEAGLGGDLATLLTEQDALLTDAQARLLVGCLASAIGYIHSTGIMFRDLKPENVIVGEDGFVRLIDFGLAKSTSERSFTLCGTLEYCAPELIQLQGHGREVDWWALGIITYELLHGYTPFSGEGTIEEVT